MSFQSPFGATHERRYISSRLDPYIFVSRLSFFCMLAAMIPATAKAQPSDLGSEAMANPTRLDRGGARTQKVAGRSPAGVTSTVPSAAAGPSSHRLPRIAPGTVVGRGEAERWNRVVLLARPVLASGDVDAIPSMLQETASSFVLTMMATIEAIDEPRDEKRFRLREVGVGFSMDLQGQLTVLSVETQEELGADLGFIERRMLESNEQQLDTARLIAKTSTLLIFDTPAILFRGGDHRRFTMRHFIWIDSGSGKCSTLVWLIEPGDNGTARVAEEPMRWFPAGTRETRRIHVDSSKFVLGLIPPESAFALEDLPPGRSIPWTESARSLAAKPSYELDELRELTAALNGALSSLR